VTAAGARLERLAGRVYESLPAPLVEAGGRLHPLLALLRGLRKPVMRVRGPSRDGGREGTAVVAGSGPDVEYLLGRFFAGATRRELLGVASLWTLPRLLQRLRADADLTIAHVDRIAAERLFGRDYLALPEWLGSRLPVPPDPERYLRRNKSLKNDVRQIRHAGITTAATCDASAFEHFYRTMYEPFVRQRFGREGVVRNVHQIRRVFRDGGLLVASAEGRPVAAAVYLRRAEVYKLVVLGAVQGSPVWLQQRAFNALYVASVRLAAALGCRDLDLGGVRPVLTDGVLRYKRKWGIALFDRRDVHRRLLVHWNRLDGPAGAFLREAPLIFRGRRGLAAVALADDAAAARQRLWLPGIETLVALAPPADAPLDTRVIDREKARDLTPAALLAAVS